MRRSSARVRCCDSAADTLLEGRASPMYVKVGGGAAAARVARAVPRWILLRNALEEARRFKP